MRHSRIGAIAGVAVAALALGACSSSKSSSGGSGASSGDTKGPITYVQGKDTAGTLPGMVKLWNDAHPTEKVTVKEQSNSADQQHDDLVQHFQAKDSGYDVVSVDVIWTAEFAAKGWLQPLKDSYALDTSALLKGPVKAATYAGTLYAAPASSDGGLLYYRKDLIPTAPTTWSEMTADCKKATAGMGCYAGQFKQYEGLTVNAAEAINSAGGEIVKSDGKTPDITTDAAKKGLQFLVDGFKQGYIPKSALTYQEDEGKIAFANGQLLFLRNWPYVFAYANGPSSKIKGKFGIAPLPGLNGPGASSLGGHSAAISTYSKHKQTALDFLKFLESDAVQKLNLNVGSLAPVLSSIYADQALVAKFPYLPTLQKSIDTAVPRPVTPFYPKVTQAIEQNVYNALQGSASVDDALKNIQTAIQSAGG
jgi:multiple sugar transport system substrate-binding protein